MHVMENSRSLEERNQIEAEIRAAIGKEQNQASRLIMREATLLALP